MKRRKIKPRVSTKTTRRVCDWINGTHDGNAAKAAAALGVSYDALLRQAYGTTARPILPVIQALALKTGDSIDWWLGGK